MRLLLSLLIAFPLWADSTSATSPTADDSGWLNSSNGYSQNDTDAEGDFSQVVQYTTFGFALGGGATPTGVTVESDIWRDGTRNNTIEVDLLNVGTCTSKETGVVGTSDTDFYEVLGSTSDTWSCTALTQANVDSSSFGVSITGAKTSGANPVDDSYNLDHVRVTIEFTAGGGGSTFMLVRAQYEGDIHSD